MAAHRVFSLSVNTYSISPFCSIHLLRHLSVFVYISFVCMRHVSSFSLCWCISVAVLQRHMQAWHMYCRLLTGFARTRAFLQTITHNSGSVSMNTWPVAVLFHAHLLCLEWIGYFTLSAEREGTAVVIIHFRIGAGYWEGEARGVLLWNH